MHLILQFALGICLGLLLFLFVMWIIAIVTQYLSGDRYFTPSKHIILERLLKRHKQGTETDQLKSSDKKYVSSPEKEIKVA